MRYEGSFSFRNGYGDTIVTNIWGDVWTIDIDKKKRIKRPRIDCGTNEELAFALAALRDDTDMYQWFVDGNNHWHLSRCEKMDVDVTFYDGGVIKGWYRKATLEELIQYFAKD